MCEQDLFFNMLDGERETDVSVETGTGLTVPAYVLPWIFANSFRNQTWYELCIRTHMEANLSYVELKIDLYLFKLTA